MKHILFILLSAFLLLCLPTANAQESTVNKIILTKEQKAEVKDFKKMNKDLFKVLKKEFGEEPEVGITANGSFFLVIKRPGGANGTRYILTDEMGYAITSGEVDQFNVFKVKDYICVGILQNGGKAMNLGVISVKHKEIFPCKYQETGYIKTYEAGTYELNGVEYWHPASQECWKVVSRTEEGGYTTSFLTADGKNTLYSYPGRATLYKNFFWTIKAPAVSGSNNCGFLALDGRMIYPQQYKSFYLCKNTGLLNCFVKDQDGVSRCGGKQLKPGVADGIEVPAIFQDVDWNSTGNYIQCRLKRSDDYAQYDPTATYEAKFLDKGEKLYDNGDFEEVITYYEGEGYGTPWGDYFMGLSAIELANKEQRKMDNCIATLKSAKSYYLPIKKPEEYKFNQGTILQMQTNARTYFEKYIENDSIPADDPTKVKARRLRGEVVTAINNYSQKNSEYLDALKAATIKNSEREGAIARQKAQEEAQAAAISGFINGLLGGKKK